VSHTTFSQDEKNNSATKSVIRQYGSSQWLCSNSSTYLSYSSDDRYLIAHDYRYSKQLDVFDANSGQLLPEQYPGRVEQLQTAANYLLLADHNTVTLTQFEQLQQTINYTFDDPIQAIAITPNASCIAVALANNTVQLFDHQLTPTQQHTLAQRPQRLFFNESGQQLAIYASVNRTHRLYLLELYLYSEPANSKLIELKGARGELFNVCWAKDKLYAATNKSVLSWPQSGGKAQTVFKSTRDCVLIGHHDNTLIVSQKSHQLLALDDDTYQPNWQHNLTGYTTPLLHQGKVIFRYRGDTLAAAVIDGKIVSSAPCHIVCNHFTINHIGTRVSISSHGYRLLHWDLTDNQYQNSTTPDHSVEQIIMAEDGNSWITAQYDQVLFWQKDQSQPQQVIRPKATSVAAFDVDFEQQQLWVSSWEVDCFCLKTGKWLRQLNNFFEGGCSIFRVIDQQRLLFISESQRRSYGRLIILDRQTGEQLHYEKVGSTFIDAVRLDDHFILQSKAGNRYRLDLNSYELTFFSGYTVCFSHDLYPSHHPVRSFSPIHPKTLEFGAPKNIPESQKRCCLLAVSDRQNEQDLIPEMAFDDPISQAAFTADEKHVVTAHQPRDKDYKQTGLHYLQVVDIEQANIIKRIEIGSPGIYGHKLDFMQVLPNNQEVLVGFRNGILLIVSL
jgi:outer membrane protein assembly factor BamB